jgi:hypothetical protein
MVIAELGRRERGLLANSQDISCGSMVSAALEDVDSAHRTRSTLRKIWDRMPHAIQSGILASNHKMLIGCTRKPR